MFSQDEDVVKNRSSINYLTNPDRKFKLVNRSVPPVPQFYDNKMNSFLGNVLKSGFSFKRSNNKSSFNFSTAGPKEIKNKILTKEVASALSITNLQETEEMDSKDYYDDVPLTNITEAANESQYQSNFGSPTKTTLEKAKIIIN